MKNSITFLFIVIALNSCNMGQIVNCDCSNSNKKETNSIISEINESLNTNEGEVQYKIDFKANQNIEIYEVNKWKYVCDINELDHANINYYENKKNQYHVLTLNTKHKEKKVEIYANEELLLKEDYITIVSTSKKDIIKTAELFCELICTQSGAE